MKKHLLSLCLVLFAFSVIAQPKLNTGVVLPKKTSAEKAYLLDDESYFVYAQSATHKIGSNLNLINSYKMEIDYRYDYIGACDNDENVFNFFTFSDNKADTYGLYVDKQSKKGSSYKFAPKKVVTIPLENKDKVSRYFAKSEDGSKIAFSMLLTDKKSVIKGIYTIVMDNSGEVMWKSSQDISFENSTIYIHDMVISNSGEVYFASISRNINNRGNIADSETCVLMKIDENGNEILSQNVEFGYVNSINLKILKNGNIFMTGYYSKEVKDNAIGLFSMFYDTKTETLGEFTLRNLEKFVTDKKGGNLLAGMRSNSSFTLICRDIYELENGNIVLLGEQKLVFTVRDQSGTYYVHHYKDIFYHQFSPTGEEVQFQKVDKYETYTSSYSTTIRTFNSFQAKNDIYFLYTDIEANHSKSKPEVVRPFAANNLVKACTVVAKISDDSSLTTKVINKRTETKQLYSGLLYNNDNHALLFFYDLKSNRYIRKLTF